MRNLPSERPILESARREHEPRESPDYELGISVYRHIMRSTTRGDAYLVERYWPGVDAAQISQAEKEVCRAVRDLARKGTSIRVLCTTFIPAEEVVLTLFEATREADVLEVHERSGVLFDRLQMVEVSRPECKERKA